MTVHHMDCLSLLAELGDGSVDSIVTDPNYGLHEYDADEVRACIVAWATNTPWTPRPRKGFLGNVWDTWVPGPDVWRECLRVLKPGGHVLAFSAPRTQDLVALALRFSGFELRDTIMWLHAHSRPSSKTRLRPGYEPVLCVRKPCEGTEVANTAKYGVGGLRVQDCRLEPGMTYAPTTTTRWPANVVIDEATAMELDAQTGTLKSGVLPIGGVRHVDGGYSGGFGDIAYHRDYVGDSGGASRFYYCARASASERNAGLTEPNPHDTVKPIALMRHLVKLVTPPRGLVVDPFTGSGTTGCAAVADGYEFLGCDINESSVHVANARIRHWASQVQAPVTDADTPPW